MQVHRGFESLPLRHEDVNTKFYIQLAVWSAVILGAFALAWRAGWIAKIATYLEETQEELRKCNWPTRDELWNSTVLVFLVIVALGLFTIGSDYVILKAVRSLL